VSGQLATLRSAIAIGTLGSLLWLTGCASTPATLSSPASSRAVAGCTASRALSRVTVDANSSFRFVPAKVCLRVGGTVTWVNTTKGLDHTSTDEPALAVSPKDATIPAGGHGWYLKLPSGKSAHRTFKVAGVYHYFCVPHETLGMVGVIDVVAGK